METRQKGKSKAIAGWTSTRGWKIVAYSLLSCATAADLSPPVGHSWRPHFGVVFCGYLHGSLLW